VVARIGMVGRYAKAAGRNSQFFHMAEVKSGDKFPAALVKQLAGAGYRGGQ
jgi:hypothetical protein